MGGFGFALVSNPPLTLTLSLARTLRSRSFKVETTPSGSVILG